MYGLLTWETAATIIQARSNNNISMSVTIPLYMFWEFKSHQQLRLSGYYWYENIADTTLSISGTNRHPGRTNDRLQDGYLPHMNKFETPVAFEPTVCDEQVV